MFHVLCCDHLLSSFLPHHFSFLLFLLILFLFIPERFYSYSFHRFLILLSPFNLLLSFPFILIFSCHSSPFCQSLSFLSFNSYPSLFHSVVSFHSLLSILPRYSSPSLFILSFPFSLFLFIPPSSSSHTSSYSFHSFLPTSFSPSFLIHASFISS